MNRTCTLVLMAVLVAAPLALGAEKGSQLLFVVDSDNTNYISVTNAAVPTPTGAVDADGDAVNMPTSAMAVTVLVQYYNDETRLALEYLRVIGAGRTILVNPFDHTIPGTEKNVSEVLDTLPMQSTKDDPGYNSGRFIIAVTAVAADTADVDKAMSLDSSENIDGIATDLAGTDATADILFPDFLAEDMHGTDNIDAEGMVTIDDDSVIRYDHMSRKDLVEDTEGDQSTRNVGPLTVVNARPVAFDYLLGHHTAAVIQTASGGSDQTASWGSAAISRSAMADTASVTDADSEDAVVTYDVLEGDFGNDTLAEAVGTGMGASPETRAALTETGEQYTDAADKIDSAAATELNAAQMTRGINGGALVLSSLHGMSSHMINFLSVADNYGGAGKYSLLPAMTTYKIVLHDADGGAFAIAAGEKPVFRGGGAGSDDDALTTMISVKGIMVYESAGKCGSDMMLTGSWNLDSLANLIPEINGGNKDYAGLDAMIDPMENASLGWLKFVRMAQECTENHGDGDGNNLTQSENPDGIPVDDKRKYTTGTIYIEPERYSGDMMRTYVTTGQAILFFETPMSSFAASWPLTYR